VSLTKQPVKVEVLRLVFRKTSANLRRCKEENYADEATYAEI